MDKAAEQEAELLNLQRQAKKWQRRMVRANISMTLFLLILLAVVSWAAFEVGYSKAKEETRGTKPYPVEQQSRPSI